MLEVAHDWHLTPSQFWACTEEDQAFMVAYTRTMGQMSAYERARAAPPADRQENG
jgi:hypothetical protein